MAFPTSPSNNQVHKEGNRSFVYDSTTGVWDRAPEASRPTTIAPSLSGKFDIANTTFPSGMVIGGKILACDGHTSGHIESNTHNSWIDSKIMGAYSPVKSSSESWLRVTFYSGMQQFQGNTTMTTCTMNNDDTQHHNPDTGKNRVWQQNDDMGAGGMADSGTYYSNRNGTLTNAHTTNIFFYNTKVNASPQNGMVKLWRVPHQSSYVAGGTYYFRVWYQTGGGTFYFVHADSYFMFYIEEIMQ